MMIPRNSIIYVIFLMCVTTITRAGNHLVNDTCHTVLLREDIIKRAAQVVCNDTARVFDPKSQNGSYLQLNNNGNWTGEIFACLCSCRLPFDPKNGYILSKNKSIILHGETLDYSCNVGYRKNSEKKIVCYDGLLMTVSDYLEKHIKISFREKSLPDWFANDSYGKIFDLEVNETANWSIPDIEVQKNQKVFQVLATDEKVLQYYVFSGKSWMLGGMNLEKSGLECGKMNSGTATTASNNGCQLGDLSVSIIVCILIAAIGIIFLEGLP